MSALLFLIDLHEISDGVAFVGSDIIAHLYDLIVALHFLFNPLRLVFHLLKQVHSTLHVELIGRRIMIFDSYLNI